jgi:hypothetical protein
VIEVSRLWKASTKIMPGITGALGTIQKGLDQNLQLLPGHLAATKLQKVALNTLMGTAHVIP